MMNYRKRTAGYVDNRFQDSDNQRLSQSFSPFNSPHVSSSKLIAAEAGRLMPAKSNRFGKLFMKVLSFVVKTSISLVVLGYLFLEIIAAHNRPEVLKSYASQECVEVISENPDLNCNNLPSKYVTIWVD